MYTFAHPLAPTVKYSCDLPTSVASYATDHLHEFDFFVIESEASQHGIGIELVEKGTGNALGIVSIH